MSLLLNQPALQGTDSVKRPFIEYEPEHLESVERISYNLFLEKGDDDWILAKCPELHVATQGKTEDEAVKNAIDAMSLMLEELGKNKEFSLTIRRKLSD